MKTLTNRMDELLESLIDCDFRTNIGIDKAKTLIRRSFKDHDKARVKELSSVGEFKTAGEAKEYCRLHGVEIYAYEKVFQIAGALMDARKDQDKITRHACADIKDPFNLLQTDFKCPICGSRYFGSSARGKGKPRKYYCKGFYKHPHNEYSGCSFKWDEMDNDKHFHERGES